jgi:hypothetical protein
MLKALAAAAVLIWLGGIAMAESPEPPQQTTTVKTEQQADGAGKSQADSAQHANDAKQVSPIANQDAAEDAKRHAKYEAEKREEEASEFGIFFGRRLKITDAMLVLFTFFLVLVGIGQGIFLFRTDQGTHKAADAAKESADAAKKAIELSDRTAARQLRAYIYLDDGSVTPVQNQTLTAVIKLKNYGQTPAYNVTTISAMGAGPPGLKGPGLPLLQRDVDKSKTITGPGGYTRTFAKSAPLNQAEIDMLNSGLLIPYVTSEVRYEDAFGRKWFLSIKMIGVKGSGPGWDLASLPEGNYETEEK